MDSTPDQTNTNTLCPSCYTKVDPEDQFCNNCGYPIKGTDEERKNFRITRVSHVFNRREYDKKLQNAANTLFFLTGIFVLSAVVLFFKNEDEPGVLGYVLPNIILAIVFLVLGGYTKKKPLACIISGFTLYIIIQILNAIVDPKTIAPGIYIKIIIIGFLIKGIKSAIEVDRIKKERNLT